VVETGKGHPSQEDEPQKGAKQARVGQMAADKRHNSQVGPPAWNLALIIDGGPLPADASIREFQ